MVDKFDYTHGDTGTAPTTALNFQSGDPIPPEHFDWWWYRVTQLVNNIASILEAIDADEDGTVDAANTAAEAENVTSAYKGNDIDSDGDGKVNAAETADSADAYKENDIDSDGDGKVDAADSADSAEAYKGNDIDSDGDGKVDAADVADSATGLTGVAHSELADAPAGAHHTRFTGVEARQAVDGADVTVGTATKIPVLSSAPSNPEDGQIWIEQ